MLALLRAGIRHGHSLVGGPKLLKALEGVALKEEDVKKALNELLMRSPTRECVSDGAQSSLLKSPILRGASRA